MSSQTKTFSIFDIPQIFGDAVALTALVTLEVAKVALLVAFDFKRTFGAGFAGFLISRILVAFFLSVTLAVALLVEFTWRALTISLIAVLETFLVAF